MNERTETEALATVSDDMSSATAKKHSVLKIAIIAATATGLFTLALVTLNHAVFAHAADGRSEVVELVHSEEKSIPDIDWCADGFDGTMITVNLGTDEFGNEIPLEICVLAVVEIPSLNDATVTMSIDPLYQSDELDEEGIFLNIGAVEAHHLRAPDAIVLVAEYIYEKYGVNIDGMTGSMHFWGNGPQARWNGAINCAESIDHDYSDGDELFFFSLCATTGEMLELNKNTAESPFRG